MVIPENAQRADLEEALRVADGRLQTIGRLISIIRDCHELVSPMYGEFSLLVSFVSDSREAIKEAVNGGVPF